MRFGATKKGRCDERLASLVRSAYAAPECGRERGSRGGRPSNSSSGWVAGAGVASMSLTGSSRHVQPFREQASHGNLSITDRRVVLSWQRLASRRPPLDRSTPAHVGRALRDRQSACVGRCRRHRQSAFTSLVGSGVAHAVSPDVRCGHPALHSLEVGCALGILPSLAAHAVSPAWATPPWPPWVGHSVTDNGEAACRPLSVATPRARSRPTSSPSSGPAAGPPRRRESDPA